MSLLESVTRVEQPLLVIIDPLFRLLTVKDGNNYNEVNEPLESLLSIARQTGAHILCAHRTTARVIEPVPMRYLDQRQYLAA